MTGIVKTDQIQGAGSSTVTVPTGHTLAVTSNATVGGTLGVTGASTLSGDLTVGTGVIKASSATTDNTDKRGFLISGHYDTEEEDFGGVVLQSASGDNIVDIGSGQSAYNSATKIRFFTGANATTTTGTETMRLSGSNQYAEFRGASQVRITMGTAGTAGTNTANWIRGSGNQVDLNTAGDGYGFEVTGNLKVAFANNGSVTNGTGSYGTISDEKLKENISDASSQWDDIKALQVRKYSMKEDNLDSADKIGVIAQELETSGMNGLVEEIEWNKETTKSVKYSILYMKSIKALQEAMARIETLEAKVTALESK
tara:strand:+ start:523 stop:1461 length:939 start_codon:yes stop_codon:yes gene_type:complete